MEDYPDTGEEDIVFYRSGRGTLPDDELAGYIEETELDAALAHKPDAVIVSNPTAIHLDVAIPAAEAGCHSINGCQYSAFCVNSMYIQNL